MDAVTLPDGPRLIHADEAACRLGVTRSVLRGYVRQGLLERPVVIAGRVAWPEHELTEFIRRLPRCHPRGRGRPKGVKNGEGGRSAVV